MHVFLYLFFNQELFLKNLSFSNKDKIKFVKFLSVFFGFDISFILFTKRIDQFL